MPNLSIAALYRSLYEFTLQWIADECDRRVTNLVWLMFGIFQARSVQLNLVARKWPIRAKKLSVVQRLARFVGNGAVGVREWYAPSAKALLRQAGRSGQIRLIIDATKVSSGHRWLMVSVAFRRRSLPLAWTWVRSSKGHSTTVKQVKLLAYVNGLLPPGVNVSLVGDCEFDHPLLIENLCFWEYGLRQPKHYLVWPPPGNASIVCRLFPVKRAGLDTFCSRPPALFLLIWCCVGSLVKPNPGSWRLTCAAHKQRCAPMPIACGLRKCLATSKSMVSIWKCPISATFCACHA